MIKVSAKDFGPIIEGAVELKPLTIFVGPSNSGKSYMATLVYVLMRSLETLSHNPYSRFGNYELLGFGSLINAMVPVDRSEYLEISQDVEEAIENWLQNKELNPRQPSFIGLPEEVRNLVNRIIERYLQSVAQLFSRELQRYHGSISNIQSRRHDASNLQVSLEQSQPLLNLNFAEEQGALKTSYDGERDITESKFEMPEALLNGLLPEVSGLTRRQREVLEIEYADVLEMLAERASANLLEAFPRRCYYLPAPRSGIAQGHKAIASMLVRQSSFAEIRPLEIPTLSGIITDFMGHILTMERSGGTRYIPRMEETDKIENVVDFLEREVVGGKIDIEPTGEITYPDITYTPIAGQPYMGKFPLHRTSSMVSELAPVILFLKYLVRPGDLLVLEEPESHLHPASQRQMARGIARLVNAGVKVIITTHSDYFMGQINNLLKLGSAGGQKLSEDGYVAEDCLKAEDMGAYHFQLDDNLGGSFVKELPIIPDFGIDEEEFAKVSEALYEETISLQRTRS